MEMRDNQHAKDDDDDEEESIPNFVKLTKESSIQDSGREGSRNDDN